jgi:hypothetical protein
MPGWRRSAVPGSCWPLSRLSADCWPGIPIWTSCLFSVPPPSGRAATASTIPGDVPYLTADPALKEQWRRELAAAEGFKIGIAWQGSRDFRLDRQRSIPLAQFAPLARLPGVRLVSVQKGFGSEQVAMVDFPVIDLSGRLDEAAGAFMDTAAVISGLDLVVTANTAIAHLAGALGVPVWLALNFSPDWRWLEGRDDTPWYPTMRIFRQTTFGGWRDVFERIANAAREVCKPRPTARNTVVDQDDSANGHFLSYD